MRALQVLVVVMGVMIVAGVAVLGIGIAQRVTHGAGPTRQATVTLDEPPGTRIGGIATAGDRLAVQLQGGGPDRILLIDPRTGDRAGSIGLAR